MSIHKRIQVQLLAAALLGTALIVLLYQIPAMHNVDIGGYDAAYVQGFHDPESSTVEMPRPYLAGSDGRVRWSRAQSFLLFPQAGLPGEVTLRLRGWRPDGMDSTAPPPRVRVLLNGEVTLADFQTSGAWEEHRFAINVTNATAATTEGGLLKATDVVIELRASTTTLPGDDRAVGVLLDQATYQVTPGSSGFILPYPIQVIYGAGIALLLWLWLAHTRHALLYIITGACVVGAAFLLLYRLQPPLYPYPLRWLLPGIIAALLAVLTVRHAPALLVRRPALLDLLAVVCAVVWLGNILLAAQEHMTLSTPGVEKDFRVFATRTDSLDSVLQADGFYNLGYPLLLWLVQPVTQDNPFLAARLVAAFSGALLLLGSYWLARLLLTDQRNYRRMGALLVVLLLAYNPLIAQYALYVGSDMPCAALVTLTLALLLHATSVPSRSPALLFLAGCAAGGAFLMRHPGLVLLPWGLFHIALLHHNQRPLRRSTLFVGGFLLTAAPQLVVNTVETGQPLYSEQAKNIWLAVYGNIDWGRWHEVPDSISLSGLVLQDPLRFLGNWWGNLLGFLGSGAEDTSEFGRAVQLRLLPWPANWLAILGLLGWLWQGSRAVARGVLRAAPVTLARLSLPGFIAIYVLSVSVAFLLLRFFLPLVPIYAVAAAWSIGQIIRRSAAIAAPTTDRATSHLRQQVIAVLLLLVLVSGGFTIGTRYVLTRQPADEVAMIRLTLATLQPGETVLARLPAEVPVAKYSALAHRVLPWPDDPDDALEGEADYLLWDTVYGTPPLEDAATAQVGAVGQYRLYRLGR